MTIGNKIQRQETWLVSASSVALLPWQCILAGYNINRLIICHQKEYRPTKHAYKVFCGLTESPWWLWNPQWICFVCITTRLCCCWRVQGPMGRFHCFYTVYTSPFLPSLWFSVLYISHQRLHMSERVTSMVDNSMQSSRVSSYCHSISHNFMRRIRM